MSRSLHASTTASSRRALLSIAMALCVFATLGSAVSRAQAPAQAQAQTQGQAQAQQPQPQPQPLAQRFRAATVVTPDLRASTRDYEGTLGYRVRERGRIPAELAASWGAPRVAGRRYALLSPDAAADVAIRLIEGPAAPDYRALTTYGWNAIEIVVQDTDATYARFRGGPFRTIGEPKNLTGYPSIRAFQVVGRAQEVLYLTSETGDRTRSPLPDPGGPVGRIFIMVVAGPDIDALVGGWADAFGLRRTAVRATPVGVVQRAQALGPEATIPLTTLSFAQRGNLLELDGYPAGSSGERKVGEGELPPGIALVTVGVRDLGALPLRWITAPVARSGKAYDGKRAATARGPAGELIEVVED